MDILNYHKKLISQYKDYIRSFVNIKDQGIAKFVEKKINEGLLWPEPLIQFNPTFEKGRSLADLVNQERLHPTLKKIFVGYDLYKHQEKAILLGSKDREFIVTSGTGSGKSLTYIATICNHVLKMGAEVSNQVQAVIVYPMNALINSQFEELKKFEIKYLEQAAGLTIDQNGKSSAEIVRELHSLTDERFPLTFAQYTGQEDEDQRDRLEKNPPHIILTNYMMLELMMTRGGRDVKIRKNILDNIRFLVFDELHTYRGRQGSDVSVLIRRIKAAASADKVICIGTSATMVSGEDTSIEHQREEVAKVASKIFGTDLSAEQVINEFLMRSLRSGPATNDELRLSAQTPVDRFASFEIFENNATANWIEEHIALRVKEGHLVRRKPVTITTIARLMADATTLDVETCMCHLQELLDWANQLNSRSDKDRRKNYLPYRLHQFIAQTGSVYTTLGDQGSRQLYLDAGLYADNKDTKLFPLVFSRVSGHEFYSVKLDKKNSRIEPQEFYDVVEEPEEGLISEEGYIFIQHQEDDELVWDFERDKADLPESWFGPIRKDGTQKLKPDQEAKLPKKIYFDQQGNFSFDQKKDFEGWFISSPLAVDPTSGIIFEPQAGEWTKVMKLGGEGRSTATTVLSFETIKLLDVFEESPKQQKLLSFTDNRQDASLQSGHFNDFVKVGQLRAAIVQALQSSEHLDYSNIADRVFACLDLGQEQYARQPALFPGPKKENEDALKDLIMYRLLQDLKRSWRVVLPNLEQCGLLAISYKLYIMEMLTTLFRAKLTTGLADFWVAANAIKACTKIVI